MSAPRVWALTDMRAGHTAHTLGLAQAINPLFTRIELSPAPVSALPATLSSQIAALCLLANEREILRSMASATAPDLVIATGRRFYPILRWIRRLAPRATLVQCLWPGRCDGLDYVLVPEHDAVAHDSRILRFRGALHALRDADLRDARITFHSLFAPYPKPHIGVLVGGHTRHGKMQRGDVHHLIDTAELLATGGTLFIVTSRRTPRPYIADMADRLTSPYYLYDWQSDAMNPYRGVLACCDGIIVSGDSISMMSEACFSGLPVLIDTTIHSMRAKHHACAQSLFDAGLAFPLRADAAWAAPAASFNEAERLGETIAAKMSTGRSIGT